VKNSTVVLVVGLLCLVLLGIGWMVLRPRIDSPVPVSPVPVSPVAVPSHPNCIQVPEASDEATRRAVADLAVKLEGLPIDSKLKASFQDKSAVVFQTLKDRELAFLVLLRTIHCLIDTADTPDKKELVKAALPELLAIAREMWASSHELKGASGDRLSLKEADILKQSPYKDAILNELKQRGITE
jgi:hypothetical protein